MAMQYTLMSHGEVLGYTGPTFPPDDVPSGAGVWYLVPTAAFDLVEPVIAELTAPPALSLVEDVIPTRDAYLHPARSEHEAQMARLVHEAVRIHHFRLVLERYEKLDLELRDRTGRRVPTTTLLVSKQLVSAAALHACVETEEPREGHWADAEEPCYVLMARLASTSVAQADEVATAA
jgi:hypothetical protein